MPEKYAKVAVSAAKYWIDRPYTYRIPEDMLEQALPGMRVYVPFGRGNRRSEGIILALSESCEHESPKYLLALLDKQPVLSPEQISLALFMRERFFCTVYEAVKTILPATLWFDAQGKARVRDKTVEMARLSISQEEALTLVDRKRNRSPQQANLLEVLSSFGCLPVRDLLQFTDAGRQSLKALCTAELVELFPREVFRRPELSSGQLQPLPQLNEEQQDAFRGLSALAEQGKASGALLFGVTGSGKTSVYIHLIDQQLKRGRSSILLVPEIALTPQMIHSFSSHFGEEIAVLHSSLGSGERYDEWKRIKSGKTRVVIGTRSAVFAPVCDLGLIILDEEQEDSYRSEQSPRYHAKDIARYRCAKAECLLLLGSATPELGSYYYANSGRYQLFTLAERYNRRELPDVRIVDMKQELRQGNGGSISSVLRDEIQKNLDAGQQSILFLNRRGANKLVCCGDCGYTYKCSRCSVSMTYHSVTNRLVCHYCGCTQRIQEACPSCGGILKFVGAGTQRVVEELGELFPEVPVLRMDADALGEAGSHEALFDRFREEKLPIMVGTQMVTKGLNFENVTLVGVISADQSLYAGNYRAGERSFSLITQVIGRSGRGDKPGRAVIQTYTPDNEIIRQAAQQDYVSFYQSEILLRRLQNAPPFMDYLAITASGLDELQVFECCRAVRRRLEDLGKDRLELMGPTPLTVLRVNKRYRYRIHISCKLDRTVRAMVAQTLMELSTDKRFRGVSLYGDNDPLD